jgi:hypothetical protein
MKEIMNNDIRNREQGLAEISSASFQIETLISRIVATAKDMETANCESCAHELFEVERALVSANRRLRRASAELKR